MNSLNKVADKVTLDPKQIELGHELGDWFIFRESRHFGPLTTKQINQFLFSKLVSIDHHVWRPGFKSWTTLKDIESFRACGHSEIDFITDNEFSFQAQLGPIDRIRFQDQELSFQENAGIKVQMNRGGFSLKYQRVNSVLLERYYDFADFIGVPQKKMKYLNSSVSIIGLALAALLGYKLLFGLGEEPFVNNLTKDVKAKLQANAVLEETTKNPSLILLEKDPSLKDPVFVGSVNLPVGSKIEVKIEADPTTLLGSFRFSRTFEQTLRSKYFQTEPILGVAGQNISPGSYNVSVTCLSCDKPNLVLANENYRLGVTNQEAYVKGLISFHKNTRESASLEIDELLDLNDTLLDQYQSSMGVYNRSISLKSLSSWNKFSVGWLSSQKKTIEMFEQIQAEDFQSKVYYLSLYEAYGTVTKMIFELHDMQDKYLTGGDKNLALAEKISEASLNAKLKLAYLKSQVDLMKINYNRTKGLPSKEGLSLSDFK